jgi:DNA-binding transcriptional MerR regulator
MQEDRDWSIGQLARFSGLSVKTVRFYSDAGLLRADRSQAGHRRYGPTELAKLELIRGLRSLDVGLDRIADLLAGVTDLQHCLRAQEQVLELRLRTVGRQLAVCRATAQDDAGNHATRLQAMIRIEAAERERLIEGFWEVALSTTARPPSSNIEMRTAGTPELPTDPSATQVDAWLSLTELAGDPDFRNTMRHAASWFSDNLAPGHDPSSWPNLIQNVCALAESLIEAGVQPDDERGDPAVSAMVHVYAEAFGKTDTPDFRHWLSDQLHRVSDPRAARWWQLVAVLQPPHARAGPDGTSVAAQHRRRAQAIEWLNTALRSRQSKTSTGLA